MIYLCVILFTTTTMSFVDRWLYKSHTGHNAGTRLMNTGDNKTTQRGAGWSAQRAPSNSDAGVEDEMPYSQVKLATTPNLRNVPWRYYREAERRNSASSASSADSMGSDKV